METENTIAEIDDEVPGFRMAEAAVVAEGEKAAAHSFRALKEFLAKYDSEDGLEFGADRLARWKLTALWNLECDHEARRR
jgi:hypothetical protein